MSFISPVGLLFAALAGLLFSMAFLRSQHSQHDFADMNKEESSWQPAIVTVGTEGTQIFGRPFVTAGWVVVGVSLAVATIEIALLELVLRL
jgi:hypothetical protein